MSHKSLSHVELCKYTLYTTLYISFQIQIIEILFKKGFKMSLLYFEIRTSKNFSAIYYGTQYIIVDPADDLKNKM
jgi:hypothetical protein